jgi:hypothetical protein
MMTAYIDESGHESKGWMFLAGYLGTEDQWKAFVPAWKTGLGPQRKSLHMTDLRWNRDRTKQLLSRLGPIPEDCGLTPILGGVRYGDYEDLVTGTPAAKLLKGWLTCLFTIVLDTLRVIPEGERLELVFEEQLEYQTYAHHILSVIASHDPWKGTEWRDKQGKSKIAKWGFVPKGTTIMTDPADYLAFALREIWTDQKSKKSVWCAPILKSGSGVGKILKRGQIRSMISETFMMAMFYRLDKQLAKLQSPKKDDPGDL